MYATLSVLKESVLLIQREIASMNVMDKLQKQLLMIITTKSESVHHVPTKHHSMTLMVSVSANVPQQKWLIKTTSVSIPVVTLKLIKYSLIKLVISRIFFACNVPKVFLSLTLVTKIVPITVTRKVV